MLHKMGYDYICAECEKPCRDEDIGDPENGLCIACHDREMEVQEKDWRQLYEGEKQAGFLPKAHRR